MPENKLSSEKVAYLYFVDCVSITPAIFLSGPIVQVVIRCNSSFDYKSIFILTVFVQFFPFTIPQTISCNYFSELTLRFRPFCPELKRQPVANSNFIIPRFNCSFGAQRPAACLEIRNAQTKYFRCFLRKISVQNEISTVC